MEFKSEKKGYSPAQVDAYINESRRIYESALAEQKERIVELRNQLAAAEKEVKTARERSDLVSKAIMNAVAKADEIERLSQIKYNQEIMQLKAFHDKWTDYYDKILDSYPLDDQLAAAGQFNSQMRKILSKVDLRTEDLSALFPISNSEKTYKKESTRLGETRIGYIRVKADSEMQKDDNTLLDEMGVDPSSPILSGDFDPIERISRYLNSDIGRAGNEEDLPENLTEEDAYNGAPEKKGIVNLKEKNPKNALKKSESVRRKKSDSPTIENAAAKNGDYQDRTPSGFSFEEALNPQQDLKDIMKDLGLIEEE